MNEGRQDAPAAVAPPRARWGAVLALSWGHFVHDVYSSFFAPLLPLLQERLGLSYTAAGVLTIFQRIPSFGNVLLGWLADRVNLRFLLVLAPTLTACSMSLIGIAPSREILALLLFLGGLGSAVWHVPAPVVLARASGRRVGTGMSLFMVAGEGARSAGPLLVLSAVTLWGPAGIPYLVPVAVVTSLLLFFATRGLGSDAGRKAARADRARRQAADPHGDHREPWGPLVRILVAVSAVIMGRSFLSAAAGVFLPAFIVARGGSVWLGGIALAVIQGAGAVGALLSGTVSDRFGRRRVLLFVTVASPLAMLAMVFAPPFLLFPCLVLLGLVAFATNPVLLALVQERAGSRPALANGVYMTVGFAARSAVVVLVGWMGDRWGLATSFVASALLSFSGAAAAWFLPRDAGRPGGPAAGGDEPFSPPRP